MLPRAEAPPLPWPPTGGPRPRTRAFGVHSFVGLLKVLDLLHCYEQERILSRASEAIGTAVCRSASSQYEAADRPLACKQTA